LTGRNEAIDVPDDPALMVGVPSLYLPALARGSPPEETRIGPFLQPAGAKTGACSSLVRRTINGRIGIQEMSGSQVFDAIIGVIIFSSI
jgi:hypothetical protein